MMERLTIRCEITHDIVYKNSNDPDGSYNILDLANAVTADPDGAEALILLLISQNLAAYEDTGLTPDEITALNREKQGLKANSLIQEHIIESGSNPLDKDKIVKLIMEITALKSENERLREQLEEAVEDITRKCVTCLRRNGWDTCKHAAFISDGEECINWQWRGEESE